MRGAPSRSFAGREPGPGGGRYLGTPLGESQDADRPPCCPEIRPDGRSGRLCLDRLRVGAHAVDALPDARFVGCAQNFNDFEIAAGRMALAKSGNEIVRGFATRMIAEHTEAAEILVKSRSEAGVSYAPDPAGLPRYGGHAAAPECAAGHRSSTPPMPMPSSAATSNAVAQYGAYSQNGDNGTLRRYAQAQFPKVQGAARSAPSAWPAAASLGDLRPSRHAT